MTSLMRSRDLTQCTVAMARFVRVVRVDAFGGSRIFLSDCNVIYVYPGFGIAKCIALL